jgi:hypothetical protein
MLQRTLLLTTALAEFRSIQIGLTWQVDDSHTFNDRANADASALFARRRKARARICQ